MSIDVPSWEVFAQLHALRESRQSREVSNSQLQERLAEYTEYELKDVDNTGHCQFDALADQVNPSALHFGREGSLLYLPHSISPPRQLTIQLSAPFRFLEGSGMSIPKTLVVHTPRLNFSTSLCAFVRRVPSYCVLALPNGQSWTILVCAWVLIRRATRRFARTSPRGSDHARISVLLTAKG